MISVALLQAGGGEGVVEIADAARDRDEDTLEFRPPRPGQDGARIAGPKRELDPSSPPGLAARERSRTAHADDNRNQARGLLRAEFATQLDDLDRDPSRVLDPESVEKFLSPTDALIDPPGPETRAIASSTYPLRAETEDGSLAPVDFSLERSGDAFEAENPLASVSLPVDLRDPVLLDELDIGVRLAVDGGDPVTAEVIDTDKLFYHEALADTDVLITPVASGTEILAQLRSPAAPERFHFEVVMEPGDQLRSLDEGAVAVIRDDKKIAVITAPYALDANGSPVSLSLEAGQRGVDLIVDHRSSEAVYPILVDPYVAEDNYNYTNGWQYGGHTQGTQHWGAYQNYPVYAAAAFCQYSQAVCWGGGLYAYASSGTWYPAGSYVNWYYTVQGSGYITNAWFGPVNFYRGNATTPNPYPYWGLWHTQYGWDAAYTLGYNANWVHTSINHSIGPNQAVFGMSSNVGGYLGPWRTAFLGGVLLWLTDDDLPALSAPSHTNLPSGWLPAAGPSPSVAATAEDSGLGVKAVALSSLNESGEEFELDRHTLNCTGTRSAPCPASKAEQFNDYSTANVAEGRTPAWLTSYDALGYDSYPQQWDLKVDRSAPKLEVSGSLAEAPGGDLSDKTYDLAVKARDGSNAHASTERSGAAEITVMLDGQQVDQELLASCPGSSCTLDLDYSLDAATLAAGQHTIEIRTSDQAGNDNYSKTHKIPITVKGLSGVLITPKKGDTTARRLGLEAERHDDDITGVTFEFRRTPNADWTTVPLENLKLEDGSTPVAYPLALDSNGRSPKVNWDLPPTAGIDDTDGAVKVRARFSGPGAPQQTGGDDPSLWWRLGESEGTMAADSSQNDHPGTYVASPSMHVDGAPTAPEDDDGAVELNGTSQYLSSTYTPFVNGSEPGRVPRRPSWLVSNLHLRVISEGSFGA